LVQLAIGAVRWCGLVLRSQRSIEAENLFLRRQLALYVERGVKPRRVDQFSRIALALLSRFFNWRDVLVVVRPQTLIRWHRAGWKLFWRLKSRSGRPPIPIELQALIRRMANENPSWGEERIANELLLKLGIQVSARKNTPPAKSVYRWNPAHSLAHSPLPTIGQPAAVPAGAVIMDTSSSRTLKIAPSPMAVSSGHSRCGGLGHGLRPPVSSTKPSITKFPP
jgi:hypothetical protein